MHRRKSIGAVFALLVTLVSAAAEASDPSVVVTLDPSQGQLPESITIDRDGDIYLSMSTSVWKVIPDGHHAPVLFATLPIPVAASPSTFSLGLKFGPDGYLYAASGGFDPSFDASHVWRISPAGQVQEYAHLDPNGFPNDLAFDDRGNLFVTDPWLGVIYKIEPHRAPRVWLSNPLLVGDSVNPVFGFHAFGADGIAFDAHKRNLYVGNLDNGQIVRVEVGCFGEPGAVSLFASDARLRGADGIAFDRRDNLYVAVNGQNQIATVAPDGTVNVVSTGPLYDSPSSVVFGTDGDSRTLYISDFAIAAALSGGTPHPALLELPVRYPGLPLP